MAPLSWLLKGAEEAKKTLIKNTTGDGMVCGLGHVNGDLFPETSSRVMAMSYDYMVLAGTQGKMNHQKKDRMFEIAEQNELPTILFAEGGGGRPGDTDTSGVAGLDCLAFTYFRSIIWTSARNRNYNWKVFCWKCSSFRVL
jgi:acetyl-CoA carboxylase carboxyltransferase component